MYVYIISKTKIAVYTIAIQSNQEASKLKPLANWLNLITEHLKPQQKQRFQQFEKILEIIYKINKLGFSLRVQQCIRSEME